MVNNLAIKAELRGSARAAVRLGRIRIYVFPTGVHPSTRMDCKTPEGRPQCAAHGRPAVGQLRALCIAK